MAIFSSHTSLVQRSKGKNAIAASAYNARTKMTLNIVDKPTGIVTSFAYDYSDGAADVAYTAIHAPAGITPENAAWIFDREQLWNRAESAEVRADAQIARKIMLALPQELTIEQNIELVKEFVDEYLVPMGMVVDVNVHNDDPDNPHVHLMLTMRQLVQNRYGEYEFSKVKNREWGKKKFVEYHREVSADLINKYLAKYGFESRVSHLSYKERGIDLTPGVHEGPARYMKQADLRAINEQIAFDNATKILENPELVLDKIAASKPVFTKDDIAKALEEVMHKGLKLDGLSGKSLEELNSEIATKFMGLYAKVMSSDNLSVVVEEDLKGRTLYAKTKRINLEKSYIELVQELHSKKGHAVQLTKDDIDALTSDNAKGTLEEKAKLALNEEQTRAVIELMAGSDLVVLEGLPGTGKTRATRQIVRQSQKAGYTVIGVAPSSSAALQLEKDAGIMAKNASLWRKAWLKAAGEKFELVMRDDYFLEDKYQSKEVKNRHLIPFSRLNRTNDFEGEASGAYIDIGEHDETRKNRLDYLKMGNGITDKHIMIIDEASMCDLTALHYLLSEANRAGAKVIMLGDRNQLSAVGYAGGLQKAVKECGSVKLVQTQRQNNPLHQEATVLLAQYRIEEALKKYQDTGSLIIDESELQSNHRLINDYVDSYLEKTKNDNKNNNSNNKGNKNNKVAIGAETSLVAKKSVAICVYTNEEARFFNNEIRARLAEAGITRGQEYEVRVGNKVLKLAKGEQIVFTQNMNHIGSRGIYNGEVGTILGVRVHDKLSNAILGIAVNKADGSQEIVEIDTAKVDKGQLLDYGYAVTAHKLQGASIEEVFVKYCKNIGYEAFNVMMTRHREMLRLYAAKETLMENILQRVEVDSNKAKARYEFEMISGEFSERPIELIALSISASKKTNSSFASDYTRMGNSAEDKMLKKYLETGKLAQELVSEISSWQLKQQRLAGVKPAMYMHPLWQQFMQIRGERDLVASEIVKDYSKYEERVIQMGINYSTLKKQANGDKWYKVAEKHTKLHTNIHYQELIRAIEESKPRQAKIAWKKLQQDIAEAEARFRDASVRLKELKDDQQGLELDIAEERKFQEERLPRYLGQIYAGEEGQVIASAVLSKWTKLQEQHGVEKAAQMVQNKPALLGVLRGVGFGAFLGLSVKRMYAIAHIERLGQQLMAYERSKVIEQELMAKQQDMSYAQEIKQIESEISRLRAMLPDRLDEEFLSQVGAVLDRGSNGSNSSSRVSRFDLEQIDLKSCLSSDKLEEIKLDILQAEVDGYAGGDKKTATAKDTEVLDLLNKPQIPSAPKKARIKFADVSAKLTAGDHEKLFYKYAKAINPYDPIEKRGNSIRCGSLHMDIRKGLWHRFSSGDGGNIYSFIQQATNVSKAEALEIVAGEIGITPGYQINEGWHKAELARAEIVSIEERLRAKAQTTVNDNDWEAYSKVPASAPAIDIEKNLAYLAKTKNYLVSYEYRNSEGKLIGYTVRFSDKENPAQKEVLPVAYCHSDSRNQDAWRMKGFSDNGYKPIYGAEKLSKPDTLNPNSLKPVLIVEGEKTADRAQELLPEYNVISWLGGAQAVTKVNWQQLQNREIVIWPDNDKAGIEAAKQIKHEIDHVNGFEGLVTIIDTQQLDLPAKWDLADELPEHLPLAKVKTVIADTATDAKQPEANKQVAEWSEYLRQPEHIYAMEYAVRSEGASYEHEYMTLKSGIYREILAHIAVNQGKNLSVEASKSAKEQGGLYHLVSELELGYKELKNEYEYAKKIDDSHKVGNKDHANQQSTDNRDELKASLVRDINIWQGLAKAEGKQGKLAIKLTRTESEHINKAVANIGIDNMKRFSDGDKEDIANKLYQTISSDKWRAGLAKVNQEKVNEVRLSAKAQRTEAEYIARKLDEFKQQETVIKTVEQAIGYVVEKQEFLASLDNHEKVSSKALAGQIAQAKKDKEANKEANKNNELVRELEGTIAIHRQHGVKSEAELVAIMLKSNDGISGLTKQLHEGAIDTRRDTLMGLSYELGQLESLSAGLGENIEHDKLVGSMHYMSVSERQDYLHELIGMHAKRYVEQLIAPIASEKEKASNMEEMLTAIRKEQQAYVHLEKEHSMGVFRMDQHEIEEQRKQGNKAIIAHKYTNLISDADELEKKGGMKKVEVAIRHVIGEGIKTAAEMFEELKANGSNMKEMYEELHKLCHDHHNKVIDQQLERIKEQGHIEFAHQRFNDAKTYLESFRAHYNHHDYHGGHDIQHNMQLIPLQRIDRELKAIDEHRQQQLTLKQELHIEKEFGGPSL